MRKPLLLNGLCILLGCICFLEHEDIQIAFSSRYRVFHELKVWNMKRSCSIGCAGDGSGRGGTRSCCYCDFVIAAMALVFGLLCLSERRATFVSSVTHELRTPLTTFFNSTSTYGPVSWCGRNQNGTGISKPCAARPTGPVTWSKNVQAFRRAARGECGVSRGQR